MIAKKLLRSKHPPAPVIQLCVNRTRTGKMPEGANWERFNTTFKNEAHSLDSLLRDVIQQGYAIACLHHTRRHSDYFISQQVLGLDFDTEDERSSFDALSADEFISNYGSAIHTTSRHKPDAPRARVLFVTDVPITDAHQAKQYQTALVWKFGTADKQCTDAARLWFGAVGCDYRILGNVLPLAVLDELAAEYDAAQQAWQAESRQLDVDTSANADGLLDWALRIVSPHTENGRNRVGFLLACRLRDAGVSKSEAYDILQDYHAAVALMPCKHPYTTDEAEASLDSAYSRRPQGTSSPQVSQDVDNWLWLTWHAHYGTKQGDVHTTMQVAQGVARIMLKAGRTQDVDIPIRSISQESGTSKYTAKRHLDKLIERGALRRRKSDGRKASSYTLDADMVRNLMRVADTRGRERNYRDTFTELQGHAAFRRRARIDVRLWPKDKPLPNDKGLGPAAHKMLAVLLDSQRATDDGCKWCTDGTNHKETSSGFACLSQVCTTHSPGSINHWADIAHVSRRKGKQVAKTLHALGIIDFENGPNNAKMPYLVDDWYERLLALEPCLTTFGHWELYAIGDESQRSQFHKDRAAYSHRDNVTYHEAETVKAGEKLPELERKLDAVKARRRAYCEAHGLKFIDVGFSREGVTDNEQASRVNGRRMGKEAKRKEFNPANFHTQADARKMFDGILGKANPTPSQKEKAAALAKHWGFPIPQWERQELAA